MYRLIIPNTKEYEGNPIIPLRIRWRYNNEKVEFNTGLRIVRANWDDKRRTLKPKSDRQVKNELLAIEEKAEAIWIKLQTGAITFHEIKSVWHSGALKIRTVDEFLNTCLSHLKVSTLTSRRNAIRSFKKHLFGTSGRDLLPSDITSMNCKIVQANIIKKGLSQNTVNSCLRGVRATYNDMVQQGVEGVSGRLILERGLIKKSSTSIPQIIRTHDYLEAIHKIRTQHDWEALAIGFLMFTLRGLDLIDLLKLNHSNFQGVEYSRPLDSYSYQLTHFGNEDCDLCLSVKRSKVPSSNPMNIFVGGYESSTAIPIFILLRLSLSQSKKEIASRDDSSLTSLSHKFDYSKYRVLSQSYGKKHKKLTGFPLKHLRKTFRTLATVHCNVSTEIGNALLGQENPNISASYLSLSDLNQTVNQIHQTILEKFHINLIFEQLIGKANQLGLTKLDSDELLSNYLKSLPYNFQSITYKEVLH